MADELRWEQPGYSDIISAEVVDGVLVVQFANGDEARLPLLALGAKVASEEATIIDGGLAVRVGKGADALDISWVALRSETDAQYARHRNALEEQEARRLGRRLKALREDRGVSQAALAQQVGISAGQMSMLEREGRDLNLSVLRQILEALDANTADISGPSAAEVSVKTLVRRAGDAGVPKELAIKLANAVPRFAVPDMFASAFAWSRDRLLQGVPETPPLGAAVHFKSATGPTSGDSPLVHLALRVAEVSRTAFSVGPYRPLPGNPGEIRKELLHGNEHVTLKSLAEWTWDHGVPVLPLFGSGGFAAAVLNAEEAPTVILKDARDLSVYWLFDLAHEIGHVACGHVSDSLVDLDSPMGSAPTTDGEEKEATRFALELLLPDYKALMKAIRRDSAGSGVRFKFSVERIARDANVDTALLGIVAAYALTDVGRPLDRWGSATNLAKPQGSGRAEVQSIAQSKATLQHLSEGDALLIRTAVLDPDA